MPKSENSEYDYRMEAFVPKMKVSRPSVNLILNLKLSDAIYVFRFMWFY